MAESNKPVSAKERYAALKPNRQEAESRAKKCAKITIPSLWREPGSKTQSYTTPAQGTGARCVNAQASQLLLAFLPPNLTPFKLSPDLAQAQDWMDEAGVEKGEMETALAEVERAAMTEIEIGAAVRAVLSEGLKHAVYCGNFLLYIPDTGPSKLYPLTSYVVDRDGLGNVLEMVTLDMIAPQMLPDAVRAQVMKNVNESERLKKLTEDVELYTRIYRDETNENWLVYQEVEGVVVPDTEGSYPIDACPWIVVALPLALGEDYGRGLIEDYRGEFETLEALRKALRKGAAACAKILWMLDPNSTMKVDQITKAESGAVIRGKKADIEALTLDKYADLRFVREEAADTAKALELVFGVGTSIQRNGERVTKEEIQYLARVLEDNRAGTYSILGPGVMIPIIHRIIARLENSGALPELPKGLVKPQITVGTQAIGRGHDFDKLYRFGATLKEILGEAEFKRRVDAGELAARLGAASDISTKGLVLEPEQVEQNDANSTMQEAAVRAAPNLASAMASQLPTQGMA